MGPPDAKAFGGPYLFPAPPRIYFRAVSRLPPRLIDGKSTPRARRRAEGENIKNIS
jgi:hypothetical protein